MEAEGRPARQSRTHELVLESIERQVLAGELKAGDRLPPERELAPALGVSRSALREALRVMETIGVLVANVGRGPDAGARIVRNPDDALGRVLRLHLALGSYGVEDVLEARVVLERSSVEAAARRASHAGRDRDLDRRLGQDLDRDLGRRLGQDLDRDLDRGLGQDLDRDLGEDLDESLDEAEAVLARMRDVGADVALFNELDTAFHVLLARSSGNGLVSTLTSAVRESVRALILQAEEAAEDWPAIAEQLNREHAELLRLVRAGEGSAAADLVERHIRGFHGTLVGPPGDDESRD
ncbi:FadR family transcriptional regulator [Streptomyces sp. ISL-36]|uniref:FadR/GntR family transcriptional regulator n=1 Tax=Streptomyces sp. ISL-36 TaxID=2819182 RepID=UPI001BE54C6D|nr:GntR family transcriptional regulator [Streptomyces sp. ISL-36]MBT2442675.1 FadR family transcriptional regulator [Streptomyces sp. ISL-36]